MHTSFYKLLQTSNEFGIMSQQSKASNTVVLALSFAFSLVWFLFIFFSSSGFTHIEGADGWLFVAGTTFAAFFIPVILTKEYFRFKRGFQS